MAPAATLAKDLAGGNYWYIRAGKGVPMNDSRHRSGGGRSARVAARTGDGARPHAPAFIRREIPPYELLSEEGLALVEGFRGDVFVWLRLSADGTIARCHLRDPSWFQWPLLEVAIEGNIVADFPLCNKSFNCSYSGHDL